jgi:hypothetical protein
MKTGYRYSRAQALANYYADVRNTANFGLLDRLKGLPGQAAELGMQGVSAADAGLKGIGQGIGQAVRPVGPRAGAVNGLRRRLADVADAGGGRVGGGLALGAGAGALGLGGYGAYRALNGEDEDLEEMGDY